MKKKAPKETEMAEMNRWATTLTNFLDEKWVAIGGLLREADNDARNAQEFAEMVDDRVDNTYLAVALTAIIAIFAAGYAISNDIDIKWNERGHAAASVVAERFHDGLREELAMANLKANIALMHGRIVSTVGNFFLTEDLTVYWTGGGGYQKLEDRVKDKADFEERASKAAPSACQARVNVYTVYPGGCSFTVTR